MLAMQDNLRAVNGNGMTTTSLTLNELRRVVEGELAPQSSAIDASRRLSRVVIDSRDVHEGDLFWALEGARYDGAQFADEAFRRGAVGVVAGSREITTPPGRWALSVGDSQQALWQLARHRRRQFRGKLVAVTGSAGKTTVRHMIHAVLGRRLDGVTSPKNYNNHVGLPLAMLALEPNLDYAVLELGASARGEIARLAGLCTPEIGVVTSIGDAHLGSFGSRRAILESKTELLAALPADGVGIVNGDDVTLVQAAGRFSARMVTVGRGADCDLCAIDVCCKGGWLSFSLDGMRFGVPIWGRHHLTSALAAIAVGRLLGVRDAEIAEALARFDPPPMRCRVVGHRGMTIIDDSYNASPSSMTAALDLLRDYNAAGRKVVVCGDMRELGGANAVRHRVLGGEIVTRAGADLLLACGEMADVVVRAARDAGMPKENTFTFRRVEDCAVRLDDLLEASDVVLVKGSRALGMERLVHELKRSGDANCRGSVTRRAARQKEVTKHEPCALVI